MYFRVYTPSGEPFDVPRELADNLILQEGWTQSPSSTAWLDSIKATEARMTALSGVDVPTLVTDVPIVEQAPVSEPTPVVPVKGK